MIELSSLAEAVGVSDRTLRRAVRSGTIRGRKVSPRKFEIPVSEAAYVRSSWRLIATIREVLRTEANVRFALLFGSAARGDGSAQSDVDLVVALKDSNLEELADLAVKLEANLKRRVDLIRLEDAERDPGFLAAALHDGRILVDRDEVARTLPDQSELEVSDEERETRKARALSAVLDLVAD